MYKRTAAGTKKDLPPSVILEDEMRNEDPQGEGYFQRMDRKRRRLWNELQKREKMEFSLIDVVRASFSNLFGATRNISMLHRGINKLNYDFDVVRVVRTLKNVSTAMQAFLSEPNKIYLRYSAQNVV